MLQKQTSFHSIRRILQRGFSARDVAEPLFSFDEDTCAGYAQICMKDHGFDFAGLRRKGIVSGFIRQEDLTHGKCGDHRLAFEEEQLISDSADLATLVVMLSNRSHVFVKVLGAPGGIATLDDLEKPAVRMWLFGMVTIIELRFLRMIERHCPNGEWKDYLSDTRIEKAHALLAERARRGHDVRLVDCLQLADKAQIVIRNSATREIMQFASKRQGEKLAKQLESLRNHLAHAQSLVQSDWETIVLLTNNLERVIAGPAGHTDLLE